MTEPRVTDCHRVNREVPRTICVICYSTAAAKIVLATSSPGGTATSPIALTRSSSRREVPGGSHARRLVWYLRRCRYP
jgi:hypothetical protein